MGILFTVIDGPHKGREFSFSGHDTFIVGRSKRAHFQLADKDKYFSRIHFLVEVNPPRCRIVDMNSHNGTYVNDQRIQETDLRNGDRIKAGHTILQIAVHLEGGARPGESTQSWQVAPATAQAVDELEILPDSVAPAWPSIPGYQILRELGRGGMGVVYLATAADGSQVALKTITPAVTPSASQLQRFLREANILQQLRHPHIVSFRAMGEANGLLFFAMDYVAGSDAAALVKQHGRLPMKAAIGLTCQLLQALEHAHAQGFVHRDIKPANLLVRQGNKGLEARLADFGLARVYQASQLSGLTLSGDVGGTVKFMPPEQVTNYRQVKPPADQYGAAATLYYLLTGKHVYDFSTTKAQPLLVIMQEEPIPIQTHGVALPDALATIIHRALDRAPEKRFADVAELRRALLPFGK